MATSHSIERLMKARTRALIVSGIAVLPYVAPTVLLWVGVDPIGWLHGVCLRPEVLIAASMAPLITGFLVALWMAPSNRDINLAVLKESVEDEMRRPFLRDKASGGMGLWRCVPIGEELWDTLRRRRAASGRMGRGRLWILQGPDRATVAELFLRVNNVWRVEAELHYQGTWYDVRRRGARWGSHSSEGQAKKDTLSISTGGRLLAEAIPEVIQNERRLRVVLDGEQYVFSFSKASVVGWPVAQKICETTIRGGNGVVGYACQDYLDKKNLSQKSLGLFGRDLTDRQKVMLLMLFLCGRYATWSSLPRLAAAPGLWRS